MIGSNCENVEIVRRSDTDYWKLVFSDGVKDDFRVIIITQKT